MEPAGWFLSMLCLLLEIISDVSVAFSCYLYSCGLLYFILLSIMTPEVANPSTFLFVSSILELLCMCYRALRAKSRWMLIPTVTVPHPPILTYFPFPLCLLLSKRYEYPLLVISSLLCAMAMSQLWLIHTFPVTILFYCCVALTYLLTAFCGVRSVLDHFLEYLPSGLPRAFLLIDTQNAFKYLFCNHLLQADPYLLWSSVTSSFSWSSSWSLW